MAASTKNNVVVELYDLAITERKDDRFGRVLTKVSMNEDDLIKIAQERRTDLNATSLKSTMEILKEIAKEQIANGVSVAFGLGYFNLGVNGVFYGDDLTWKPDQHNLAVRVTPTAELREAVNSATVTVRGAAPVGVAISTLTDVTSGQFNSRLTPGGGVNIEGTRLRIAGENSTNGLSLINQATQESIRIPMTSVLHNEPSQLTFIVPANLPAGDYKLQLTTQFSTTKQLLNEPRIYLFDYILTV
ncbi:hypothetical protein SDC9_104816 [bioreactor metagenome]|uniref:Uncharacterized protein n=1 Tax=bioreactor metagenome TaxID=1076179 RepID=A0A645AXU7_9ZZZZ|nr:DUF4469 domain-containing protein [Paludibacter sp.]